MWTNEGKDFEQPPTGTHLARCIKIIDIGTQTDEYQGKSSTNRKNIIYWELPTELRDDGKPFVVSKFYTASLGEKANLRKDLVNWRGRDFTPEELKGFDERTILGKGCQVTLTRKESGKVAVSGIVGLPKGVEIPDRHNDIVYFSLNDFSQEVYDKLGDGIKSLIKKCAEYDSLNIQEGGEAHSNTEVAAAGANDWNGSHGSNDFRTSPDDDIPF